MRKYQFVTAYEPAFPDIKKVLLSHQNIIYEDEELREVFPNGASDFQVSERRDAKNIKELLATSTISTVVNEEENSSSGPIIRTVRTAIILEGQKRIHSKV